MLIINTGLNYADCTLRFTKHFTHWHHLILSEQIQPLGRPCMAHTEDGWVLSHQQVAERELAPQPDSISSAPSTALHCLSIARFFISSLQLPER